MAAILVGKAVVGAPGQVHSTAKNIVGTECDGYDANGLPARYIYLKGVASTAIGTWVTYDEAFLTTRTAANAQGLVAVATAATVASTWGWYQRRGAASGLALTAFADDGKVYLTSTAGSVDDADVSGDFVCGAIGRSAVNETTLLATFEIYDPFVQDTAFD